MKTSTLNILNDLYIRYPALKCCKENNEQAMQVIISSFKSGGKLLTCGNGGSAADAQHIVGELMKAFALPRKLDADMKTKLEKEYADSAEYLMANLQGALPTISLVGETALTTAYANDMAPDLGFAQQVYGYGKSGDVLLVISTSGNSKNVLYAAQVAHTVGMKVIGLTGQKGGMMRNLSDVLIAAPSNETYKIQEYHLPIYHALCLALENEFFGEND